MLPAERKRTIVQLVTEQDGCSVATLADELNFSKATIRRDLQDLETEGRIERSHGGAVPVSSVGHERSYDQREVDRLAAKQAIAGRASEEVRDGHVVCFDAGTTTTEVARAAPDSGYIGVTNMPELALELADSEVDVKMTGGTMRPRSHALVGPAAESFLDQRHFDLLFLGTNGVTADTGLTTPDEDEAAVKRRMVANATRVVLVADSSKFGERSFVSVADPTEIDLFVTDVPLPGELADAFAETDVVVTGAD
ncbi:DeoR/GlpR family DNA-binding transcription regulator [Haloarcula sp. S1CR25-12]|uniref:DeoR/GlpR family DNA-binding transcription regulator n=1 Tax=Haloarcula saliterrae TaxID=2950534 RepID=A0ABU2F971_9EURY|nr:HTH-type transcriptional regulator GlpR [Haloarcula sp. S1CR25-12]MDS0258799.1 DeoR/GlpR family DNA-binding transcription regulator [Haloarcula sp. S1CR25-12]